MLGRFVVTTRILLLLACLATSDKAFAGERSVWLPTAGVEQGTLGPIEEALLTKGFTKLPPIAADFVAFSKDQQGERTTLLVVLQDRPLGDRGLLLIEIADCLNGATLFVTMCDKKEGRGEKWTKPVVEWLSGANIQATSSSTVRVVTVAGAVPTDMRKLQLLVVLRQAILSDARLRLVNRQLSRQVLAIQDLVKASGQPARGDQTGQMLSVDTQLIVRDSSGGLTIRIVNATSGGSGKEMPLLSPGDATNLVREVLSPEDRGGGGHL